MSEINLASHEQILHFPKGGKPTLTPNDWQVWSGINNKNENEGANSSLPYLEYANKGVLVPFSWWLSHINSQYQEPDVIAKIQNGQIGVWFATDDDVLKYVDVIEAGKKSWPLVAAHFPIFRDGRSFSTAALLRDRFSWTGEIRAIGDVLIDQLLQGARVGFDSFSLRLDQNLDVALKQFDLFTVTTQNSWRGTRSTRAT
ncbi:DUF934 domain-containing protein [Polynucleobacter sp. MWH-UH19D]|uniref:DUF934 domain-containing protein n=1 Tax=Polynucleobacter sp. MWH-UH19D TaxID=1855610 RepID=UPI0033650E7D